VMGVNLVDFDYVTLDRKYPAERKSDLHSRPTFGNGSSEKWLQAQTGPH